MSKTIVFTKIKEVTMSSTLVHKKQIERSLKAEYKTLTPKY